MSDTDNQITELPTADTPENRPDNGNVEDIIPVPILIGVFVFLWVVVLGLLSPDWAESMRSVLARREARNGNWSNAIGYYEKLTKVRPNNPSYLGELAYVQSQLGKYDEAVQNYKRATEVMLAQPPPVQEERGYVRPKPDHYSADIGRALFLAGKFSEAKSYLQRFLTNIDRRHSASHFYLANIFLKEGAFDLAAAHLAAAADNGYPETLLQPIRKQLVETKLPADLR